MPLALFITVMPPAAARIVRADYSADFQCIAVRIERSPARLNVNHFAGWDGKTAGGLQAAAIEGQGGIRNAAQVGRVPAATKPP